MSWGRAPKVGAGVVALRRRGGLRCSLWSWRRRTRKLPLSRLPALLHKAPRFRAACRSCGSCEPAAPVTVVPGPFVSRSAYNPPVLHLPKNTPEEKG